MFFTQACFEGFRLDSKYAASKRTKTLIEALCEGGSYLIEGLPARDHMAKQKVHAGGLCFVNQSKHVECIWCTRRMYAGGPCFVGASMKENLCLVNLENMQEHWFLS